jgi:hypothetical protein
MLKYGDKLDSIIRIPTTVSEYVESTDIKILIAVTIKKDSWESDWLSFCRLQFSDY